MRTWWPDDAELEALEQRYGPVVDRTDPTEVFVIDHDHQPVGLIQSYRLSDNPEWQAALAVAGTPGNAVGIDYLIGVERLTGLGLGPEVIDRFVWQIWSRYPDVAAVVVSTQAGNRRSWRALEKAGFRRAWSGELTSDDPSDAGISHVYVRYRSD